MFGLCHGLSLAIDSCATSLLKLIIAIHVPVAMLHMKHIEKTYINLVWHTLELSYSFP